MKRRTTKFNYFDAFASQAELAAKEAELLMLVVENFDRAEKLQEYLPEAHRIENEADEVHHSIHDALLPDFVPPLDREDITSIASSLDEVVDLIEELILSFYMYDVRFMHTDAIEFAKILHKSCIALCGAVKEFPRHVSPCRSKRVSLRSMISRKKPTASTLKLCAACLPKILSTSCALWSGPRSSICSKTASTSVKRSPIA